jgi:hypothetical protein
VFFLKLLAFLLYVVSSFRCSSGCFLSAACATTPSQDGLGELFGDLNDAPPLPGGDSKTFASLFEPVAAAVREVAREADAVVDGVRGVGSGGGHGSQLEALVQGAGLGGGGGEGSGSVGPPLPGRDRAQYREDSSDDEDDYRAPPDAGSGVQRQAMRRDGASPLPSQRAVPVRRRDSRSGKQVLLADHSGGDSAGGGDRGGGGGGCFGGRRRSRSRSGGANDATDATAGDGADGGAGGGADGDEEALLEGSQAPRRRRKKKGPPPPRPGSGCGCFCCMRCLCRGCCTVLTCKCCSPADPEPDAASGDGGKGGEGAANSADGALAAAAAKPWFVRRHCPGCFGEGTFAATRPCCAKVLRLWCALLNLGRKLLTLVAKLTFGLVYYFCKCLLTTSCDTLVTCCPSLLCLALWCPTSVTEKGEGGEEWEDVPEGEAVEDEVRAWGSGERSFQARGFEKYRLAFLLSRHLWRHPSNAWQQVCDCLLCCRRTWRRRPPKRRGWPRGWRP